MLLVTLGATNYKSYLPEQKIAIDAGFNLFIGGNNSGKTSLLEAMDFNPALNTPHRSMRNLPEYGGRPTGHSSLSATIRTSLTEMVDPENGHVSVALPETYRAKLPNRDSFLHETLEILRNSSIELTYSFGGGGSDISVLSGFGAAKPISTRNGDSVITFTARLLPDGQYDNVGINAMGGGMPAAFSGLRDRHSKYFYRFSAQRRPSGVCGPTDHPVTLEREAINLPYCLNTLQSTDSHGYEILCEWIHRVFPSVAWVQASPIPGNMFEVMCLPTAPLTRRDDLAVPLSLMGTGIGNVIAILYVVLTARMPQIIAIDEPNSFLHPRALRELLQILAVEGKRHQYILTAHSADVITAIDPSLITIFNFDGAVTTIKQVESSDIHTLRVDLSDLGIRMTDLHGRDRVLWVEGQTEELVIPELLRHFCPDQAPGTAVLRVEHTGTFERKKGVSPVEVTALYKRLSEASALVPPMVAILLDRENRTAAQCEVFEKESKGELRFLDRPMLEDYLLHPGAIAHVLNSLGEATATEAVSEQLATQIKARKTAAHVLEHIFSTLSDTRNEFKKTRDVPPMVSWLLRHDPAFLSPLGDFLQTLFSKIGTEEAGNSHEAHVQ